MVSAGAMSKSGGAIALASRPMPAACRAPLIRSAGVQCSAVDSAGRAPSSNSYSPSSHSKMERTICFTSSPVVRLTASSDKTPLSTRA